MAANGNLIFQDTNKATFVGANSNVVIDTVNASLGVGVDVNGPTSNLHVVGNAYVTSNLEVGTANLFVNTTSGKVGVGTNSPSAKLHIVPDDVTTTDLSSFPSQWGSLLETQWLDTYFYSMVSYNQVEDVAVDSNGNVYVTGWYKSDSTWNVGNSVTFPAQSGFNKQSFTIKYNSTGTPQWGKITGGNVGEGRSIVTDSSGNVYVTGSFNNSAIIDLGNSVTLPNVGTSQSFTYIVKYDTDGTAQWANAVEATNGSNGYGIAVDSNGNVYATGQYRQTTGTTSLGNSISLPQTNSDADPYTIKYNSSGVAQWANGIGTEGSSGAGPNYGYGIATDSDGNVYVTGSYYHSGPSAISLGNGVTIAANSATSDAFIVKYNTAGTAQWANVIDSRQTIGYGIATDSSGNVYVTGIYEYYGSSISLGNSVTLPDAYTTGKNIFTAKYDTNGVAQWADALETSTSGNNSYSYGIATDSNGNVYVTGTYSLNSSIDLGNNFTLPVKSGRGYVVVYDTDGTTQGVRVIDATSGSCTGRGVAAGSNGTIVVCGNIPSLFTGGSVTIDDTTTLTRTTTFNASPDDNIGLIIKYSTQTSVRDTGLTVTGNVSVVGGGDFVVDTDTLYVSAVNSRVGVGTNAPVAELHVAGTGAIVVPSGTTAQQPTGVAGMIRFNATIEKFEFYDGTVWSQLGGVSAIGGTVTNVGGYTIHTFTSSGTFTVISSGEVEYLVVAGGGGGGSDAGGGGGAGGMLTGSRALNTGTYTITRGAGGSGGSGGSSPTYPSDNASNGSDSAIINSSGTDIVRALGGGLGGMGQSRAPGNQPIQNGGSGGGGGGTYPSANNGGDGGLGTSGQGNNGSRGLYNTETGGGGGGAGGPPPNSVRTGTALGTGQNGGPGRQSDISGTLTYYAGGGGGGAWSNSQYSDGLGGIGGGGGGGAGTGSKTHTSGRNGTSNTGGGGGGGTQANGGSGGSGIVIIRYLS